MDGLFAGRPALKFKNEFGREKKKIQSLLQENFQAYVSRARVLLTIRRRHETHRQLLLFTFLLNNLKYLEEV